MGSRGPFRSALRLGVTSVSRSKDMRKRSLANWRPPRQQEPQLADVHAVSFLGHWEQIVRETAVMNGELIDR